MIVLIGYGGSAAITPAHAQEQVGPVIRAFEPPLEPLAQHVPIEAGFYMRVSDRAKWQTILGSISDPGQADDALFEHVDDVAFMAASWRQHTQAVMLCVPRDATAFSRYLGITTRPPHSERDGVRRYRIGARRWMATNGTVFIFDELGPESQIFELTVALLGDDKKLSLHDDERFIGAVKDVDVDASFLLFFDEPWAVRQGRDDRWQRFRPRWLPALTFGMVEGHLGPRQVRCHINARRSRHELPLPNAVHAGQLQLLPEQTMFVWTRLLDAETFVEGIQDFISRRDSPLMWHLVRGLLEADLNGELPLRQIGPRFTMCMLDSPKPGRPRVAIFFEAGDAAWAVETIVGIGQAAANHMRIERGARRDVVEHVEVGHRGHTLHTFKLPDSAGLDTTWRLEPLRPTVTAIADQIIIASEPQVAMEIIDWHRKSVSQATGSAGSMFALPILEQWVNDSRHGGDDTQVRLFANLRRMSNHLATWQRLLKDDGSPLLNSAWYQELARYWNDSPVQLGARLRNHEPGRVQVIRVLEGRPAAKARVRPDDIIVGFDNKLLSMDDAKSELKSLLSGGEHKLRIERDGKLIERRVILPDYSPESLRGLLMNVGAAMGELSRMSNLIESVTYRQHGTATNGFTADLNVNLSPER